MVEVIFYISGIMFFGVSIALMLKCYLVIHKMSDTTLIDAIMSNPEVEGARDGVVREVKKEVDDKTSSLMTEAITKSMAKVYTNFVKTAVPINEPETLEQEICDDPFLKSAIKDNLPFLNKYGMFLAPLSVGLKTASHVDIKNIFNRRNDEEESETSEFRDRAGTGEQDGDSDQ